MSSYRFADNTATPLLNTAVSGTSTYTTPIFSGLSWETVTFRVEWTGNPTGTISILGSLDGVNFRSFGATVGTQPGGSADGVLIPLYGHGMKWLQVQYTNESGSGNLVVTALGKTR